MSFSQCVDDVFEDRHDAAENKESSIAKDIRELKHYVKVPDLAAPTHKHANFSSFLKTEMMNTAEFRTVTSCKYQGRIYEFVNTKNSVDKLSHIILEHPDAGDFVEWCFRTRASSQVGKEDIEERKKEDAKRKKVLESAAPTALIETLSAQGFDVSALLGQQPVPVAPLASQVPVPNLMDAAMPAPAGASEERPSALQSVSDLLGLGANKRHKH
ncbi:hypothetical protein CYMTET_7180 [Cymbomonas tetramitiformis]|uniref:Uncharacterized protein n=1 Tax=Cymbomonas tetramitiformis TaxID=36881 RepID=A0AAE0GVR3_9CHLO|nr:hypothetical protein CYMTET_7180 [Cymbomonas tetramitiformis]